MIHILEDLRGGPAVSCQAAEDSSLHQTYHIVALAPAVATGGAKAVPVEGVDNVAAVRETVSVPVIGVTKIAQFGSDVHITPSLNHVRELCTVGADIVAFDATKRPRPSSIPKLIAEIHRVGRIAMADINTLAEAAEAMDAGANFVGTKLSGYNPCSSQVPP
ncbi:N-acetylmannosamine-6-phosphate 2-epimerase [Agrobacterium tumefaciens]|uniref:N-acetylmannosamine-6-phosphate 2-epimerase n=1 Tax=Agrobacterium tumefaciens TaxID=358 RepID=UPI00023A2752|nr:N-acetylmannosamine-6-phosphate 2-epimerase [Agrobacterium tumefaciens 5A]